MFLGVKAKIDRARARQKLAQFMAQPAVEIADLSLHYSYARVREQELSKARIQLKQSERILEYVRAQEALECLKRREVQDECL